MAVSYDAKMPMSSTKCLVTSPGRGWVEMDEYHAYAPRRHESVNLTRFLHDDEDYVKSGNRTVWYKFAKTRRTLMLYSVDLGEERTHQDPYLIFPAKDWSLFYNYVWDDLRGCGNKPLYVSEWDGITSRMRYRIVGDHCNKKPEDCVYIFTCDDNAKQRC